MSESNLMNLKGIGEFKIFTRMMIRIFCKSVGVFDVSISFLPVKFFFNVVSAAVYHFAPTC